MSDEQRLREFIGKEVHWEASRGPLRDDFPLIESNLIDSLGIFHIVSFVEQEFGIEVLDEELIPENFGTITEIARFLSSKGAATPASP